MYKQKLDVLATDRRRGGTASNPMQDTSVYRSTVEELHTNSSLLTRAARPRSASNRSLERDAAAAFPPTPLTYSSSPQPVRANAGAGQVLSHSYDATGDASFGSMGALGPPYPSGYGDPTRPASSSRPIHT